MADSTIQQKLTAEVIGTFVLVFFGCGSVVYATQAQAPSTTTTIGLTFGVAVMVMAYSFGRISGAHFNPAVSVGAAMGGRMPWREVGLYVLAQLAGAVVGALLLFLLMHGFEGWDAEGNMGQNAFGDVGSGYAWWAAFLLELFATAVFVIVILAVTDERNEHPSLAPLTIGFTLAAIHFVLIPATGTSVNPARSIGPALFAGPDAIKQLWLFILAPLLGAAIAGLAYPLLFGRVGDAVAGSGISFSRPRTAAQLPGYAAPDQYQQQWNQESTAAGYEQAGYDQTGYEQAGYDRYGGGQTAASPAAGSQADAAAESAGAQASGAHSAAAQPIIQDGWQWDPIGQQWHPVGQSPEEWRAQQAREAAAQQAAQQQWGQQSGSQGYGDGQGGDPGTQVRPPS